MQNLITFRELLELKKKYPMKIQINIRQRHMIADKLIQFYEYINVDRTNFEYAKADGTFFKDTVREGDDIPLFYNVFDYRNCEVIKREECFLYPTKEKVEFRIGTLGKNQRLDILPMYWLGHAISHLYRGSAKSTYGGHRYGDCGFREKSKTLNNTPILFNILFSYSLGSKDTIEKYPLVKKLKRHKFLSASKIYGSQENIYYDKPQDIFYQLYVRNEWGDTINAEDLHKFVKFLKLHAISTINKLYINETTLDYIDSQSFLTYKEIDKLDKLFPSLLDQNIFFL